MEQRLLWEGINAPASALGPSRAGTGPEIRSAAHPQKRQARHRVPGHPSRGCHSAAHSVFPLFEAVPCAQRGCSHVGRGSLSPVQPLIPTILTGRCLLPKHTRSGYSTPVGGNTCGAPAGLGLDLLQRPLADVQSPVRTSAVLAGGLLHGGLSADLRCPLLATGSPVPLPLWSSATPPPVGETSDQSLLERPSRGEDTWTRGREVCMPDGWSLTVTWATRG